MPILADYHMHSSFSGDSRAPMQDMAARAIALGYQEICFTEHMDLHYPASEECPEDMFLLNTDSYLYDLLRAREKFGKQINIKFGVELGLQPDYLKEISDYARSYDFDFIIGSTMSYSIRILLFPLIMKESQLRRATAPTLTKS